MSEKKEVSIKYSMDEIFACRDANCLMPEELEQYCNNLYKSSMTMLIDLIKPMDDITKSHSHGINPNDITLKNVIRENLNKINHSNYKIILEELKGLNYTSDTHFAMLASELIIKSMNDVMACKGIESTKKDQKTNSEIYTFIAGEFTNYFIKQGANTIKFKTILFRECQLYFDKLTDKKEKMDNNNPHRHSNYKGFMNMIGLMYTNGLFPKDIVKVCGNKIIKLILSEGLSERLSLEETDNYYSGYERLINRVLYHFEKKPIQQHMIQEFNAIKDIIKEMNDKITKGYEEEKKDKSGMNIPKPIKTFSIMTHQQNNLRFKTLCEIYKSAENNLETQDTE